jgi:aryl-alcohol dehydrogenase-like predicted oxidoreductase
MRYRTLGRTAVSGSEIGFGAWAIGGPVSTVIPGIRSVAQAEADTAAADLPEDLLLRLRRHAWNRAFWYAGK